MKLTRRRRTRPATGPLSTARPPTWPPTLPITYPVHTTTLETDLTVISGSASDLAPGTVDRVLVSYYKVTAPSGWWNSATKQFNSGVELFQQATLLADNRWQATGVSTPTWVTDDTGVEYNIFAKAVDVAGNEV